MKSKDLDNLTFQVTYIFEIQEVSGYFLLPIKVVVENKLEK